MIYLTGAALPSGTEGKLARQGEATWMRGSRIDAGGYWTSPRKELKRPWRSPETALRRRQDGYTCAVTIRRAFFSGATSERFIAPRRTGQNPLRPVAVASATLAEFLTQGDPVRAATAGCTGFSAASSMG